MKILKQQNAASSMITVTSTSTGIFSLINTAGGVTNSQAFFLAKGANAILITPEDGDIRIGYGYTPTASVGTPLSSGTKYYIPNLDSLADLNLIRTSADVSCSVDICKSVEGETGFAVAEAVTLEASSITIGSVDADITHIAGTATAVNTGNATDGTQRVVIATDQPAFAVTTTTSTEVPESGTDGTGADAYATILTPSKTFEHISIANEGVNPAVVSIDGGTTDTFKRIPGGSLQAFDGVAITATAIQAKNFTAGSNYADLTIIVW